MKRFLAFFATIAIMLLLCVSPLFAYDKTLPEDIGIEVGYNGSFSCPMIFATGTAAGLVPKYSPDLHFKFQSGYWGQMGSGFVAARGFIFTAAHVINPDTIVLPESEVSSRETDTVVMTSRTVLIKGFPSGYVIGKVAYENRETDTAVIRYDPAEAEWLIPIAGTITYDPIKIEQGDKIVGITHKRGSGGVMENDVRVITGYIIQPYPDAPHERVLPSLSRFDITCFLPIHFGDSGSPLFAFANGKPILIGIIRAMYFDGYQMHAYAATTPVIWKFVQGRR